MNILDWVLGRHISNSEENHEKIGTLAGIPILGLDALSSAAYGPEAALTLLIPLGAAGVGYLLPIIGIIIGILLIVFVSYKQTIFAYPGGGGSYTVAKENLGRPFALLAGAALALDYVVNVAVGISAGIGALVSAFPTLLPHTLALCLGVLVLLTIVNLRGLREAGLVFLLPTWAFVGSLLLVIGIGVFHSLTSGGHPAPIVAPPPPITESVAPISAWLLIRAFASGCTAMTGVEAVSNGVPIFKEPGSSRAARTLTLIIALLVALLLGVAYLAQTYGITASDPESPQYQSTLSILTGAIVGRGVLYYFTIGAVVVVLALSANTSFADFPRLCRVLAEDRYLPDSFALRGRRLVYSQGIIALAIFSGALLIAFGGVTDRLIPIFAIGAFLAFTLSQAGMVVHFRREKSASSSRHAVINAVGAIATGATLVVVAVSKFTEGAWLTILVVPTMVLGFSRIRHHYDDVAKQIVHSEPLPISPGPNPVVVVACQSWNKLTERGLEFGMRLSPDVHAIQVKSDSGKWRDLRPEWARLVEEPATSSGHVAPKLVVVSSQYRQFFKPLNDYVLALRDQHQDRDIVVVIPDLVVNHWYQGFLHNHRGTILRALLRRAGGPRVVVVNTPFPLR